MKKEGYQELEQGDIILISIDPTKMYEQRSYRPCIVLTKKISYLNYMYGLTPITYKAIKLPLQVPLLRQLTTKNEILLEHHRMIDLETMEFKFSDFD